MSSVEQLLNTRQKTHGDFAEQAKVAQELKRAIVTASQYPRMTDSQKEALAMILHKVSRIVCGNPDEPDHWDDITGYATLGKNGGNPYARKPVLGGTFVDEIPAGHVNTEGRNE